VAIFRTRSSVHIQILFFYIVLNYTSDAHLARTIKKHIPHRFYRHSKTDRPKNHVAFSNVNDCRVLFTSSRLCSNFRRRPRTIFNYSSVRIIQCTYVRLKSRILYISLKSFITFRNNKYAATQWVIAV